MKKQTLFVLLSVLLFVFGTVSAASPLEEITDTQETMLIRIPYNGSNFELLLQLQSGEVSHGVLNAGYGGEDLLDLGFEFNQNIEKAFIWCSQLLGNTVIELTQEEVLSFLQVFNSLTEESGTQTESSGSALTADPEALIRLAADLTQNEGDSENETYTILEDAFNRYAEYEVIDVETYLSELPEDPESFSYFSEDFDQYAAIQLEGFRDSSDEAETNEIAVIDKITIQPENVGPMLNAIAEAFTPMIEEAGQTGIIDTIHAFADESAERITEPVSWYFAHDGEENLIFSDLFASVSSEEGVYLWNVYYSQSIIEEFGYTNLSAFVGRTLTGSGDSEIMGEVYFLDFDDYNAFALSTHLETAEDDTYLLISLSNPWKERANDETFSLAGAYKENEDDLVFASLDLDFEDLSKDDGKVYRFPILLSVNNETVYDETAVVGIKATEKTTIIDPSKVETVTLEEIFQILLMFAKPQNNTVS